MVDSARKTAVMENDPQKVGHSYENNAGMWIIKKTVLTYSVRDSLAPEDETQRISYKTKITNSQDADFWQLKEDCCLSRLAPTSTTPSLFCGDLTVATFL